MSRAYLALILIASVLCVATARTQNPVRTATLGGVVTSADTTPRPLRRVQVTVRHADYDAGATTTTDDDGRFSVSGLPAGRYLVRAARAGFVTTDYGASRPGRPATPIVLAEGQRIANITLRLLRSAAISGTIVTTSGEPAAGVQVAGYVYVLSNGERVLRPYMLPVMTNDRGEYRIHGLVPGEYCVAASGGGAGVEFQQMTPADVRFATEMLSGQFGRATSPSMPSENRRFGYAGTYYPGTANIANAGRITLTAGEERTGVDFSLSSVRVSRLEIDAARMDGGSMQGARVSVADVASSSDIGMSIRTPVREADGIYRLSGFSPGRYTVIATVAVREPVPATWWGSTDVDIDGQDVERVRVQLRPGASVSGRVVFDTRSGNVPSPSTAVRMVMTVVRAPNRVTATAQEPAVWSDAAFVVNSVVPGRYFIRPTMNPTSTAAGSWFLKDVTLDGRNVSDVPLEVSTSDIAGLVATFTDRPTELTGVLQDASGRPAPDFFIVVFPGNSDWWGPQSRRIQALRPATDGRFSTRGLPPGEYRIAALTDVEQGEWFDATFLRQLVPLAISVTLREGETTTQNLQIK